MRFSSRAGVEFPRNPIRGTFPGCCASALAPHTVSATTIANSPAHFRFGILDFRLSEEKSSHRIRDLLFMLFSSNLKSAIENLKFRHASRLTIHPSPNYFVHSHQHVRWNRQADLLGGFQFDDEFMILKHRLRSRMFLA